MNLEHIGMLEQIRSITDQLDRAKADKIRAESELRINNLAVKKLIAQITELELRNQRLISELDRWKKQ